MRWFRSRAHRDRCREEVDILHAEQERTLASFERMGAIWTAVAEAHAPIEGECGPAVGARAGRQAYSFKQAAIYAERAREAQRCRDDGLKLRANDKPSKKRAAGDVLRQGACRTLRGHSYADRATRSIWRRVRMVLFPWRSLASDGR